jgi:hypothetical protein
MMTDDHLQFPQMLKAENFYPIPIPKCIEKRFSPQIKQDS